MSPSNFGSSLLENMEISLVGRIIMSFCSESGVVYLERRDIGWDESSAVPYVTILGTAGDTVLLRVHNLTTQQRTILLDMLQKK